MIIMMMIIISTLPAGRAGGTEIRVLLSLLLRNIIIIIT
jgi:hypothetical protein